MPRPRKLPEGIKLRNGEYHCDFYAGGRRVRKRLSGDLEVARQLLNEMRARADRADFGLLDNDYPLADLEAQFLGHCRQALKPSSTRRYRDCLRKIMGRIGANRTAYVNVENIIPYRQDRLDEGASPRTINMEVGALSTMFNWGVEHKRIGSNPISGIAPLPHDHPKEGRALSEAEVGKLLTSSPQPWRDIWYAFLVSGLRKEELAGLTFADIDRDSRELIVRAGAAKNHSARRIPIEGGLWAIIERQEAGRQGRAVGVGKTPGLTAKVRSRFSKDHVFVSTQNTPLTHRSGLYHAFMRCCRLAGIETKPPTTDGHPGEHVDLHSLRRTFATSLIVGGADPKSVQELLGHKTLDMTMRIYAKVHVQTKRQALGKLPYGEGALAPGSGVPYPETVKGGG